MELSKRLKAIADMVTRGSIVADIGCDHGYIPIYLVEAGICEKVIAMDVNKGPLLKAGEHIDEYHYRDYIETRLSDGVTELKMSEADTVIIAGMGGRLTVHILENGLEKIRALRELILQPQSEIAFVRSKIQEFGFSIIEENMVFEDGKFYPMMHIDVQGKHGVKMMTEIEKQFGPCLLKQKNKILVRFLQKEADKYEELIEQLKTFENPTAKQRIRIAEMNEKLEQIKEALSYDN